LHFRSDYLRIYQKQRRRRATKAAAAKSMASGMPSEGSGTLDAPVIVTVVPNSVYVPGALKLGLE
jgi:hypothetical protein